MYNLYALLSGRVLLPLLYKQEEILHELTISVPIYDTTLVKYCTDIWVEDHIP